MTMNTLNVKLHKTSPAQIDAICRDVFGIQGNAKSLASERDETILVRAEDGRAYVLKIANAAEQPEVLDFQTKALLHLASKSPRLPVPEVIFALDGTAMPALHISGETRLVRMLSFLEGEQLSSVPRSLSQMAAIGTTLADLGLALADFGAEVPDQALLWDLTKAGQLRRYLGSVANERRAVVRAALEAYEALAAGAMAKLPSQVIHNDFNPHNILTAPNNSDQIVGVIDFGDMLYAPNICDLAVAMSYHLATEDGLAPVLSLLRGYNARRALNKAELAVLPVMLRMRLAMTLLITEWRSEQQPENATYILRNHPACWDGLIRLLPFSDTALAEIFGKAVAEA